MDIPAIFNETPYVRLLDIEVTTAADGHAEATLTFSDDLLSNNNGSVAHGGSTYSLADTVGGAAVISLTHDVAPTVDMRMDYLAPATSDLHATADVLRNGSSLAMVRIEIHDDDGTHVATAQGTYKTDGQGSETPWRSRESNDD